jgi:hypothetical protein
MTPQTYKHSLSIAVVALIIGSITLISAILWDALFSLKSKTITIHPGESSEIIQPLEPQFRLSTPTHDEYGTYQSIHTDPVYLHIKLPTLTLPPEQYTLSLTTRFRNDHHDDFRMGIRQGVPFAFDITPVHNRHIDALDWHTKTNDNLTLYERQPSEVTIDTILENPPTNLSLATYFPATPIQEELTWFRPTSYRARTTTQTFPHTFRGNLGLLTYIENESLNLTFDLTNLGHDIRDRADNEHTTITISNHETGEHILTTTHRIPEANQPNRVTIKEDALPRGIYRIQITVNTLANAAIFNDSDTTISNITTTAQYLTTLGDIMIAPNHQVFTHDTRVKIRTATDNTSHEILINNQPQQTLPKQETDSTAYQIFTFDQPSASTPATAPLNHIQSPSTELHLISPSPIALSEESHFIPAISPITKLDREPYRSLDTINAILTTYTPPQSINGLFETTLEYDLASVYHETGEVDFVLSAPELAENNATIDIYQFTLTLTPKEHPSLQQRIKNAIKRFI